MAQDMELRPYTCSFIVSVSQVAHFHDCKPAQTAKVVRKLSYSVIKSCNDFFTTSTATAKIANQVSGLLGSASLFILHNDSIK